MKINRLLTNLCSHNLEESKAFYLSLFDFTVSFDSEWFVHLLSENRNLELGIIQANHELVPQEFNDLPAGMYLTFVVDDVTVIYERVKEQGYTIVKEPELTFYGQRRLLIKDPGGVLVDVSSPEAHD